MSKTKQPGTLHQRPGKEGWWQNLLNQDKIEQINQRFESMEKNIEKLEREIRFAKGDFNQRVSVSEEFMKFFGLK